MKITILFSTFNGEKTLPGMLDRLTRIRHPSDGLQIIAVDNASTDNTQAIFDGYRNKLPLLVLDCKKPGKNNALNSAIDHIESDLVILTDDDILPAESWLMELHDCALQNENFQIFGGKIIPYWPGELPSYVERHVPVGMTFAVTPSEIPDGPVDPRQVWGANMAVRTEILREHRFNGEVGPIGENYIMGSETELTVRLSKLGFKSYFTNAAVVSHIIRKKQLEKKWLYQRSFKYGRSLCFNNLTAHQKNFATTMKIPNWVIKELCLDMLKYVANRAMLKRDKAFKFKFSLYRHYGYTFQALVARKNTTERMLADNDDLSEPQ